MKRSRKYRVFHRELPFFISLVVVCLISFFVTFFVNLNEHVLFKTAQAAVNQSANEFAVNEDFVSQVSKEYEYRKKVELEAPRWAEELSYIYKWSLKYGVLYNPITGVLSKEKPTADEFDQRAQSEFAWMMMTGFGLAATFDLVHADQSLLGSTSRIVSTLVKSAAFWREVKNQCREVVNLAKIYAPQKQMTEKSCAERIDRDLKITQLVGSNVSLFVGGGVVITLTKKVFAKYFASWFARKVLPLIPIAARSKWALTGATVAVIVLPTGVIMASLNKEKQTSKEFLEHLSETIQETEDERLKTSIIRLQELELEQNVLKLAQWIHERLPDSRTNSVEPSYNELIADNDRAAKFFFDLKMMAPGYLFLTKKVSSVVTERDGLEQELGQIQGLHGYLMSLYEKKREGISLTSDEKVILRKAEYLAALRLVAPVLLNLK